MQFIYQLLEPISQILITVLDFFNQYVHSYGWSIILLTLTVRIFILPLTIKQSKSMKEMQKLQPKIKELQKKYKNDKEKLGQETMKLYKEHKINPLSGCFPLLLQLPIFFALFDVLRTHGPLEGASFLIIPDLSIAASAYGLSLESIAKAYPYYILIIAIVVTTYFSQKQTTADARQAKMMAFMPVLIGVISWSLPAGVLLYWVVFNLSMVGQQYATDRILESKEDAKVDKRKRKK